jgi:serine/threonine protein kinase/Flp pilus assembly protein TadD
MLSTISHYRIIRQIGSGGMGEVYLAEDTRLGRKVALKLLYAELTKSEDRLRRFEQEARAASALSHPNILVIHDIGTEGDSHFITSEFIEGETLRQQIAGKGMSLQVVLETAVQVASALAAAHKAGILHRDIKPENIMLREDGYVKVLDFGLAKLTEQQVSRDTAAPTIARVDTDPGTVMGTVNYMSPEQAKGKQVDARSDLFSLGVVLYESIAGRMPFEGESNSEILAAILDKEPSPLARYSRGVPDELERIVSKALRKDREERYQTAKDLLIDLKSLKQGLEFEAQLERSLSPESSGRIVIPTASGTAAVISAPVEVAPTSGQATERTVSSAEYIISEIRQHSRGFAVIMAVLVIAAAVVIFFLLNRTQALNERDTIVLADFANTTGDAVFDGTLKQALAAQLGQSPFLNILSDERAREALRFMGRSPDERVTNAIARQICERQGLKAMLTGSISSLGSHYIVLLEAVNARSGDSIAREQVEADSKEQVIASLGRGAARLREKLGESLASIQKFDAPIEQATTSSLEALKAYSLGTEQRSKGNELESIPFFKHAIELDPNFAAAYARLAVEYGNTGQPDLARETAQKAFALRDRTSEREKFYISERYYNFVTGELDKQIEVLDLWKRTYPRDTIPHTNLGVAYTSLGEFEKALEETREAISLSPDFTNGYSNAAGDFMALNRFDDAKAMIEQAMARNLDSQVFHALLYQIAFVNENPAAMKQQVDWATGKSSEFAALALQARTAAFAGQSRKAREFTGHAVELTERMNLKELAAGFISLQGETEAALGDCRHTHEDTPRFLSLSRNLISLLRGANNIAMCGDIAQAQSFADELVKQYPKDTLINSIWLPVVRAQIELSRGNYPQAIHLLQPASRYENASFFWVPYLLGQAYLRQRSGAEAAAEFQKIINHRGIAPAHTLYPLAYLGLARASSLTGDTTTSRKAFQDFFALWKDADPDISILQQAKKEYEKLK